MTSFECLEGVAEGKAEGKAIAPLLEPEGQWQPEGVAYCNGELVLHPRQRPLTEQLDLLDTHPIFTGRCPECEMPLLPTNPIQVHWDCSNCGWMNDSV